MKQGNSKVVPTTVSLVSRLPPFSRGGTVRTHSSFAVPLVPHRSDGAG
jgi:hypothetical protein